MFFGSWSCTLVFWLFSVLFWIFCKLSALTFLKCYSFLYLYPLLIAVLCSRCIKNLKHPAEPPAFTRMTIKLHHGENVIQLDLLSWSGFTLWSNGVLLGWGGSYQLGLVPRAWTKPLSCWTLKTKQLKERTTEWPSLSPVSIKQKVVVLHDNVEVN